MPVNSPVQTNGVRSPPFNYTSEDVQSMHPDQVASLQDQHADNPDAQAVLATHPSFMQGVRNQFANASSWVADQAEKVRPSGSGLRAPPPPIQSHEVLQTGMRQDAPRMAQAAPEDGMTSVDKAAYKAATGGTIDGYGYGDATGTQPASPVPATNQQSQNTGLMGAPDPAATSEKLAMLLVKTGRAADMATARKMAQSGGM